jgi:hypothetical protein
LQLLVGSGSDIKKYVVFIFCIVQLTSSSLASSAIEIPLEISVNKNQIVDATKNVVQLHGVNKSGTEYACAQGWGIFDGKADTKTVEAMKTWNINVVRVPLNESCWLGINGVKPKHSGLLYRKAITDWVQLLNQNRIYVILDLHISNYGNNLALRMPDMANADHSIDFWQSVASTSIGNNAVIFDAFNEPKGITWNCWRDGCTTKAGWKTAGMQQIVNAIRGTGASQPIILEGISTATDLSRWMEFKPNDPLNQLVASNHNYIGMTGSNTEAAWNPKYSGIALQVPLITGELGQQNCMHDYVDRYMDWADSKGISYLGWTWNVTSKYWKCVGGESMITTERGTPSNLGVGFRNHFLARAHSIAGSSINFALR